MEVNQSFARTFGYSALDLIGRQPEEIGLWSSHSAHRSLQQAARGERELHGFTETFSTNNGHLLLCEVASTRIRINHQQCVLFSFRDITARTQAESALRASEDKFARAFKGSPDSISISELKTGRQLEVNDGFVA
ncbi:PAS domain S-box protein [Halopseudomonas pachastrellae]|nr:PAS domain S-box protein [Halopseudomonas pachastrellae]